MMFGPDSTTSPTSPGAHSVPSGPTTRTSTKNCDLPGRPHLATASALSSTVPAGADSVIP